MTMYRDRRDAGRQLAEALRALDIARPVVLGIPRGGVPVAAEIAAALQGELGVVVARKLGAPGRAELALGAITSDGTVYLNEPLIREIDVSNAYLAEEQQRQRREAERREASFDGHRRPPVDGRTVIVVDDGLATGATAIAAVRAMRRAGAERVLLAVPVAPPESVDHLTGECDGVVCPRIESDFWAVGQFYEDFRPTSDAEVRQLLADHAPGGDVAAGPVVIRRDGVRLAADLLIPAHPVEPDSCVVFVHGLGSGKDSPRNRVIGEHLRDRGFAVLLFDLNGHGESDTDPRGNAAFVDDLKAAVSWVRTVPGLRDRIGVAGSSLGAVVALQAVQEGGVAPQAMVFRAPPIGPTDLDGLTIPTRCIIGEHDPLLGDVRQAAGPAGAPVDLVEVPGASHLFEEPGALDAALDATVEWFERHLRGTTGEPGL